MEEIQMKEEKGGKRLLLIMTEVFFIVLIIIIIFINAFILCHLHVPCRPCLVIAFISGNVLYIYKKHY